MVHALEEVHRVLVTGGVLVDARPDSRVPAYAERVTGRGFERFGIVNTSKFEARNDAAADAAIGQMVRRKLFQSRRHGRFFHRVTFGNLPDLREYLREHLRFVHRAHWLVDSSTLRRHANDRFAIRRPVRYEVFESI